MGEDRTDTEGQPERIKRFSLVDVLEPLATEEIDWLSQRTPERTFQTGEMVYAARDASEVVFLLLTGRIRLYGIAAGRDEFTFEVIQAGTLFGEASLAGRAHPEYAQALEPSRVGLLHLNTFWQLVSQNPQVNAKVMKLLVTRSYKDRSRMSDLASKEVSARLASLILELLQSEGVVTREGHYRLDALYTHEHFGTMIGAKRVSVTRAFKKLQENGCVQLLRRQVYVTDLATLSRLAVEGQFSE
jgi:CRP/FNR family transcriptional regulator, cyclic AMP receptor protein